MEESVLNWDELIRLTQALLVPALVYLTRVLAKLGERLDQVEKDQIRTNTLLETRQNQRVEDKQDMRDLFTKLESTISRLADRLDHLETYQSRHDT
jgi:hypothetical protein